MGQFKEAIEGMSDACRAFDIAVTGGNVSFYNDTEGASIYPTPVLGIVGLIEDLDKAVTPGFKDEGDAVILIGESKDELGGTEYLKLRTGKGEGRAPALDLKREKAVHEVCLQAIEAGWVKSAQDPSEGGLAVCAAECAFHSPKGLGATIDVEGKERADALLFGESQSRILVTASPKNAIAIVGMAAKMVVPAKIIGNVGGTSIVLKHAGKTLIDIPVAEAKQIWKDAIPNFFKIPHE